MYDEKALPELIRLMHKDKEGVKAAAAQLSRNIFVLDIKTRRKFRDLGGIHGLLSLLEPDSSSELQLEGIYHIEDLILQNGEEIVELIECVKVLALGSILERILEVSDEDVGAAAKQLYLRIAD